MSACAFAGKCGGCEYINLPYEEQLKLKNDHVVKLISQSLGKSSSDVCFNDILSCENPYYYRNKVHAAFARQNGKIICGTYEASSHKIVENFDCVLENRAASKIISDIKAILNKYKASVYDEKTGRGTFRRVLIRVSSLGEIMVVLVVADDNFVGKKNFIKELTSKNPDIKTIVLNVNTRKDSMILGDRFRTEYGPGFIIDDLFGLKFKISPDSFFQINHEMCLKLYSEAISKLDLKGNEKVLDAYCGTGTIGITVAKNLPKGQVTGVELNKSAVGDAINNASKNGIKNIKFICADATEYITAAAARKEKFDAVILDPPRSGTTPEFINAVSKLSPSKVVYISCLPDTLARDLKVFESVGYKTLCVTPCDMFSFTGHVETVCLLSQLSEAPKMEMRVKLTEFDLTEAEAKATYSDIKEYVKEHTGLKVSSLYIAQVKQKYGIIERDCYNLPKSDDSRQPKCPEHKEKAIVEALKHFKMI